MKAVGASDLAISAFNVDSYWLLAAVTTLQEIPSSSVNFSAISLKASSASGLKLRKYTDPSELSPLLLSCFLSLPLSFFVSLLSEPQPANTVAAIATQSVKLNNFFFINRTSPSLMNLFLGHPHYLR